MRLSGEAFRELFDREAERYNRARPGFPAEAFDDLEVLCGLAPGDSILEIGPGTGQATVPLAERGYRIVAVELGGHLAEGARRNLARFPSVEVIRSTFEDWRLPAEPFDAVVCANAFQFLDPTARVIKSADALRLGGSLAALGTRHVAGGSEDFFVEVQECYERWDPSTEPGVRLERPGQIPRDAADLESSGRFGAPTFRRYEWDLAYSRNEYLDVLQTFSGHLALPTASLEGLLDCIATLMDSKYGGSIVKHFLTELRVAKRIA